MIDDAIREAAARWIAQRDRGLSARESIEFELWLAADERHAAAIRRCTAAWMMLNRIPENVGQTMVAKTARRTHWRWAAVGGLAAAATLAVAFLGLRRPAIPTAVEIVKTPPRVAGPQIVTLEDGSTVLLNAGAEIDTRFTAAERRVQLVRGEAHFTVAKNPARPFVVRAGMVEFRAVGTGFDINFHPAVVKVLVTDGRVAVEKPAPPEPGSRGRVPEETKPPFPPTNLPVLEAGQLAVVAVAPVSTALTVVVTTLSREEVARILAWQNPLLRFGGATLAEVVAEFERRTGRHLILEDQALAGVRIGGRFRADDLEGFVLMLEENYGIRSERPSDGTIILRRATAATGTGSVP